MTVGGGAFGSGTVFKLDPSGHETVLYSFMGGSDGNLPSQGLIMDAVGNLYGTTNDGGSSNSNCTNGGSAIVFNLHPFATETVLYLFTGGTAWNFPFPRPTM